MKALIATALLAAASLSSHAVASPAAPATSAPRKADPVAIAQRLLDDLYAGHFDAVHARFGPQMAMAVSTDQLRTLWASLPQQFGKLQHRGEASVQQGNGMTLVTIPLAYERGSLVAVVGTDAQGKVQGFVVRPAPPPAVVARADLSAREVQFGPPHRTTLPGTLLLPKGKGPFPAVVLVHGSGPNDRDETAGGTRVFRDIAEGLADRGIASLRYEKRTKAHPDEFGGAYTIDNETTDDAAAAADFLTAQPGIDIRRVFVVGHSQGAMMAPRIAQRFPQLAGIVLMAAPARHLEDILLDQNLYMAHADGRVDADERKQLAALKKSIAAVKGIDARTPKDKHFLLGIPASYWLNLKGYDDVTVARGLRMPMLVLQGDRDFQVTAPDWKLWHDAFARDPRVTIRHYPALNHLFVAGKGPGSLAEYATPGHVDVQAIGDIAAWIKAH